MTKTNDATRATGEALPEIEDALDANDRLQDAVEKIELIRMAAASLERPKMNAIARACFEATEVIEQVQAYLHPQKGGAA